MIVRILALEKLIDSDLYWLKFFIDMCLVIKFLSIFCSIIILQKIRNFFFRIRILRPFDRTIICFNFWTIAILITPSITSCIVRRWSIISILYVLVLLLINTIISIFEVKIISIYRDISSNSSRDSTGCGIIITLLLILNGIQRKIHLLIIGITIIAIFVMMHTLEIIVVEIIDILRTTITGIVIKFLFII